MSEARALPQRLVIAGDGQVGVIAAVALKRALPSTDILVIGGEFDLEALADTASSALPFTNRLHDSLGVDEDMLVQRCGASHRLVLRYVGWGGPGHDAMAPYGGAADPALRTAFARDWGLGMRHASGGPAGSVGEALARAGRFARPSGDVGGPLADLDYCLRWNGPAYRELLIEYAHQLGVRYHSGRILGGVRDGEGGLAAVAIDGVGEVPADLFLDCTGPRARLLSQVEGYRRIDWSGMLPVRGLIHARRGDAALGLIDSVSMTPAGWLAECAGRDGRTRMLAAPEAASEEAIRMALGTDAVSAMALASGRAADAWLGNVIALGDAAATFEPLGWLNLDLAHRQLSLLLELLPGRVPDLRERDEFNRRAGQMADRACDFVAAHYAARGAAAVFGTLARSEPLALALDQFERRGRLPFFEETPMLVQEWTVVLHALGIAAGNAPVRGAADPREAVAAAEAMARKCDAAVRSAPSYGEWMTRALQPAG